MNFDRIKTSTTSTGTGDITVGSAAPRCQPLSAIPTGTTVTMVIEDENGTDWEISDCTVLSASTFSRDAVLAGSNGAAKVNFGAGEKTVFCTTPASKLNAFLTAADGIDVSTLPTISDFAADDYITIVRGNGTMARALASLVASGGTAPPADTTAPTLSSATGTSTGTSTASGSVSTNESGGTLYFVATVNATETAATVKAGGSQAVTATGVQNVTRSDLTAATAYRMHFLHRDAAGNDSAVVSSAQFTTASAGDTTAPTLSSPTATQTGETTASGTVSTNEANGTLYWLVSTSNTATATAVKAGSSQAVTAAGSQSVAASSLTAGTAYYIHYLHRDAAGNDSAVSTSAQFTTAAAASNAYVLSNFTKGDTTPFPTTGTMTSAGSESYADTPILIRIKTAANTVPPNDAIKFVWGKSSTVPPISDYNATSVPTNSGNGNTSTRTNSISAGAKAGTWSTSADAAFGNYRNASTFYAWGTPGVWYLWVLTSDGFIGVAKDAQGNPATWTLS